MHAVIGIYDAIIAVVVHASIPTSRCSEAVGRGRFAIISFRGWLDLFGMIMLDASRRPESTSSQRLIKLIGRERDIATSALHAARCVEGLLLHSPVCA